MRLTNIHRLIRVASPLTALVAAGALAGPAAASTQATQAVTGVALSSLSLTSPAPAAFGTTLSAGTTPTASSTLVATDTSPSWTLSVQDAAAGTPGHMVAGTTGCTGSDPSLANPVDVTVTSALTNATSNGAVPISGTVQAVLHSAAAGQLLAANVFTTSYSVVIPTTEVLNAACSYSMTATYTLG